jgi:hypothetical protein
MGIHRGRKVEWTDKGGEYGQCTLYAYMK